MAIIVLVSMNRQLHFVSEVSSQWDLFVLEWVLLLCCVGLRRWCLLFHARWVIRSPAPHAAVQVRCALGSCD